MFTKLRILTLLFAVLCGTAQAEPRIALIVGNSNYDSILPLDNPTKDATLIGETLEDMGFEVTLMIDASQNDLKRAIVMFGRDLRKAGKETTGLFYYAGHGVQSFGTNYLLPVDASLTDAADLDLVAIEASAVLRQMFSARNRTNIVILDACRNNPFEDIVDFTSNGLAEMKAPTGTFLSYATAPGGVALDGLSGNSPFTESLAEQLRVPGLPIEQMFKQVRVAVLEKTRGLQTPWDTSSLTNDFKFVAEEPISPEELAEIQLWNSVQATQDPVQVMLFLRAYPDSRFRADARALLAEVMAAELEGVAEPRPEPPAATGPSEREQALFNTAQSENTVVSFESYLAEFPQGVFAEYALGEIEAIKAKASTDPIGEGVKPVDEVAAEVVVTDSVLPGVVKYLAPLALGPEHIAGRTIEQLALGTPLFPPIPDLPEEYWKEQQCSNCHEWTRERLCTQAMTYLGVNAQRALDKQHPYGGGFKRSLKIWAAGDCQ